MKRKDGSYEWEMDIDRRPVVRSLLMPLDLLPGHYKVTVTRVRTEPELKTCPFCGGGAETYARNDGTVSVRCPDCGASSLAYMEARNAIAAWSRRV